MRRKYRVKVIEKHSDTIEVVAETTEEAMKYAIIDSKCSFECVYDCEILDVMAEDEGEQQ